MKFLDEATEFQKFWTPQKPVTSELMIKPEKSYTNYFPGGAFHNRKKWLRPCALDFERVIFGDSMLKVFFFGDVKFPNVSITSYGGMDLTEGIILIIFGKLISPQHT